MPTFNQLVRKGRQTSEKKSTAPALQKGYNSLKKRATNVSAPQKRGVCTAVMSYFYLQVKTLFHLTLVLLPLTIHLKLH